MQVSQHGMERILVSNRSRKQGVLIFFHDLKVGEERMIPSLKFTFYFNNEKTCLTAGPTI
jgi:hypothetical protein